MLLIKKLIKIKTLNPKRNNNKNKIILTITMQKITPNLILLKSQKRNKKITLSPISEFHSYP